MTNPVQRDNEASELLGEDCFLCIQCGATSVGDSNVIHYATCAPPNPKWFVETEKEDG